MNGPGLLATLAACGEALAEATQALRGVLGDRRKPIPEIVEALRLVGLTQSYVIEAQQRVSELQQEVGSLRRQAAEAKTVRGQLDGCRREVRRGSVFLVCDDSPGAYYCPNCSTAARRVALAPLPRDFGEFGTHRCTQCELLVTVK